MCTAPLASSDFNSDYQALNLTPEQIAKLEGDPQDLTPKFKKVMCCQLHEEHGLTKLAIRVDDCSTRWRFHDLPNGRRVKENMNPCHEAALCENCAELRWDIECQRYINLAKFIKESFTYIVTIPAAAPKIRKIVKKLGPILSKFCWNEQEQRFEVRILVCAHIHDITYRVLQSLLAIHPTIRIRDYGSHRFAKVLNRMLAPMLPHDLANRLILKNTKRRLQFEGASRDLRKSLFDRRDKPLSNKNSRRHPANGFCHIKNCQKHTQVCSLGTPEHEFRWIQAPSPPS